MTSPGMWEKLGLNKEEIWDQSKLSESSSMAGCLKAIDNVVGSGLIEDKKELFSAQLSLSLF